MPRSSLPEWRASDREQSARAREYQVSAERRERWQGLSEALKEFRWSSLVPDGHDTVLDPQVWNIEKVVTYRNLHFLRSRSGGRMKVISIDAEGRALPVGTISPHLVETVHLFMKDADRRAQLAQRPRAYSRPQESFGQQFRSQSHLDEKSLLPEFRFSIVRDQDNVRILKSADGQYLFGPVNGVVTVYRLDADGGYSPSHPVDTIARADVRAEILRQGNALGWNLKQESVPKQNQNREYVKDTTPEQTTPERAPEQKQPPERTQESVVTTQVDSLFRDVQSLSIMIAGERVSVSMDSSLSSPQLLASFLRKRGVTPARYEVCARALRQHLAVAENGLQNTKSGPWKVVFVGNHFELQSRDARLFTTMTSVLRMKGPGSASTLEGEAVTVQERPTTTEYRFRSKRELHRSDGTLQFRQEGDQKQYFDGSNTPLMERTNDRSYIVGVDGKRIDVARRVTKQSVDAYAKEIVDRLRSPEAIGAFVSQFWLSKEFKGATPENAQWLSQIQREGANPVNFVLEKSDIQDVQHWRRTLVRGSGDCEDFALLAKELLKKTGIESFAMRVKQDHFETVYFEKAGIENGRQMYTVCTVGLLGFHRSVQTYPDLGSATKSLWAGNERKDLKDILPSISDVKDPTTKQIISDVLKHGGAEVYLDQPENEDDGTRERTSVLPYGGQYAEAMFSRYVR